MDTAVMDLINTVQLENSGADVSAAALFKGTSDLPKGDINYGNIFDIYKFDNTLYRVSVTGAELKAYMEWSAECYNQWQEGDINISFDPSTPTTSTICLPAWTMRSTCPSPRASASRTSCSTAHPSRTTRS